MVFSGGSSRGLDESQNAKPSGNQLLEQDKLEVLRKGWRQSQANHNKLNNWLEHKEGPFSIILD
jgi:hypothetical protein